MPNPASEFETKVGTSGGYPLSSADRARLSGARDAGSQDGLSAVDRRRLTPPIEESPTQAEVPDQ